MQARELVLLDRDAEAVKVVREHTAVGIIEARGIVEDMRRRLMRGPVTPASSAPAQSQQSALAPAQSQQSAASNYSSFTPQTAPTSPPREATSLFGNAEAPRLSANEIWADDEPTAVSQPADPVLANAWR